MCCFALFARAEFIFCSLIVRFDRWLAFDEHLQLAFGILRLARCHHPSALMPGRVGGACSRVILCHVLVLLLAPELVLGGWCGGDCKPAAHVSLQALQLRGGSDYRSRHGGPERWPRPGGPRQHGGGHQGGGGGKKRFPSTPPLYRLEGKTPQYCAIAHNLDEAHAGVAKRMNKGDEESALRLALDGAALHPKDQRMIFSAATLLELRGRPDEAVVALKAVIALNASHCGALVALAHLTCFKTELDVAKARALAARATAADPTNPFAMCVAGQIEHYGAHDLPLAKQFYRTTLEHSPEHFYALSHLGRLLHTEAATGGEGGRSRSVSAGGRSASVGGATEGGGGAVWEGEGWEGAERCFKAAMRIMSIGARVCDRETRMHDDDARFYDCSQRNHVVAAFDSCLVVCVVFPECVRVSACLCMWIEEFDVCSALAARCDMFGFKYRYAFLCIYQIFVCARPVYFVGKCVCACVCVCVCVCVCLCLYVYVYVCVCRCVCVCV